MDYDKALQQFVDENQRKLAEHYEKNLTNLDTPSLEVDPGRAYDRVVKVKPSGRKSVFCFVKKRENTAKGDEIGDILKAASWKGPAKHPRGNIFDASRLTATTTFGARYINR